MAQHLSEQTETVSKAQAGKYLTFKLAAEEYGLEILKVREIIGLMAITKVPRAPQYIRGVINLRGKVIPVMDLRMRFEMEKIEDTEQTCVIVVDAQSGSTTILTGIVVDSVSEVLEIAEGSIEDTPNLGASVDTEFIMGMAKVKEEIKILLDIDQVLENTDMSIGDDVAAADLEMAEAMG